MRVPKQLINIVGLIVVLGIVAAGGLLVALPIFLQAQATKAQTQTIASANSVQEVVVAKLAEQAKDQAGIESTVTALQKQIPASPKLDDVFEIAARAATTAGVTLEKIVAEPLASFAPAAGVQTADGGDASSATDPGTSADAIDGSTSDASAADGRVQIPVTITVTAASVGDATKFVDALRSGPRLIGIVHASTSAAGGVGAVTLTVSAITFAELER